MQYGERIVQCIVGIGTTSLITNVLWMMRHALKRRLDVGSFQKTKIVAVQGNMKRKDDEP